MSRLDDESPSDVFYIFSFCLPDEYSSEWCQHVLDFLYRMIHSGLMGIDYPDNGPTNEEIDNILKQLSINSPNCIDGLVIWSTYQFYLTDKGSNFIKKWIKSDDDDVYLKKLNDIFVCREVGFDKRRFISVNF